MTPESTVRPGSGFALSRGKAVSGDLSSLAAQDGDALRLARFIVPNNTVPPVSLVLTGGYPKTPLWHWARCRARSSAAGTKVELAFWDYGTNNWDTARGKTETVGQSWSYFECVAKRRDRTRLVSAADNAVKVRLEAAPPPGPLAQSWWIDIDELTFEDVQE